MTPLVSLFMSTWAILALAMFVVVILLSYRIEKRSDPLVNRSGFPRWAMLFHTITNLHVARDAQTQRLRSIMLMLLAGIIGLFILVAIVVSGIERPA
jgi:cellulose synthase/poly-beta-1,6-N-acetylglucosamine synthase-like glycosyltransferase